MVIGWGGDGGDSEAARPTPRPSEKHGGVGGQMTVGEAQGGQVTMGEAQGGQVTGKLQVRCRFGDKKYPFQTHLQQLGDAQETPGREEAAGLGSGQGQ